MEEKLGVNKPEAGISSEEFRRKTNDNGFADLLVKYYTIFNKYIPESKE